MNRKFVLCVILVLFAAQAFSQGADRKNKFKNNPFATDKPAKWIMGLKTGVNRSTVSLGDRYSVLGALDDTSLDANKKIYDKKNKFAPHLSLMITFFPIANLGLSFQPAFFSYKYGYKQEYDWTGESNTANNYKLSFVHKHTLNYAEMPLYLKYYIINRDVHAFVQFGGFYGKMLNAKKDVSTTGIDNPGEAEFISTNETQSFDVNKTYIRTYTGLVGGGGIGFKADNFRFALEVNYRKGMNNITNEKNRYANNRLVSAFYDAPDDIKFRNIEVSLSCSLPLDNLVHVAKKSEMPSRSKRK